jgi:hypothetical protein
MVSVRKRPRNWGSRLSVRAGAIDVRPVGPGDRQRSSGYLTRGRGADLPEEP